MKIRVLAYLCLLNTSLLPAATVSWDGGGDGISWTDAANWTGDALPEEGDDVIIDAAANPVIQVVNTLTLRSLNSEEDILFSGDLTLTGGTSIIKATTYSDRSIYVSGGAEVQFPALTTLQHPTNRTNTIQVDGVGSSLSFPNVVSIQGSTGISDNFLFYALNGGRIELPKATAVTGGAVTFTAEGADSVIDLDDLTTFTGDLYFSDSGFRALNGGVILSPALDSFHDGDISCDTPGNLTLDQLTSLTGSGTVTLTGGSHDLSSLLTLGASMEVPFGSVPLLSSLTTLENASLFLTGGAVLDLPLVTVVNNLEHRINTLQADGVGSRLSIPNAISIQGSFGNSDNFLLNALNGGRIEIPKATEVISGAVTFTADGAGSVIDLDDLITFTGDLYFSDSGFRTLNGGVILTPSLTTVHDAHLTSDSPGSIDLSQLESLTGNGTASLTGGTHDLSSLTTLGTPIDIPTGSVPLLTSLTTIENASISLTGGAILELPLVTSISNLENLANSITVDGVGSRLSVPNATSIQGSLGNSDNLIFSALNGGRIELPKVTEVISGAVTFTSDGAGSVIDLDDLTTFTGNLYFTDSGFRALNGGSILSPDLTTIHDGHISCDTPGNLTLSQITTITGGGTISLTGGPQDLTALTSTNANFQFIGGSTPVMTALSNIDGASLYLSAGAVVDLPLVTSYTQSSSPDRFLQADGPGTLLDLSNLITLTSNNAASRQLFIQAFNGGEIDLSGVTAVDNPTTSASYLQFIADGTDSLIDLSSLLAIDPNNAQIFETNDGIVFTPGLNNASLPDLHILSLTPSTTTLSPGAIVSLTWTVQNDGGVDFDGTRRDSIFLSDDPAGSNATRIANFSLTNLLASGSSESITRDITIPATGFNGTVYLLVRTDESLTVIESNETNNQASTAALVLPASLTLNINRSDINEQNGGSAVGYLSRNGDTSAPLTVTLSETPVNQLTIPATLTFHAGQSTRSFLITPIDDQIPDGDANVTITAQAAGFSDGQDSILVLDGSVPSLEISVDNTAPTEGDTINVTVTRNKTTGPLDVTVTKSPASQAGPITPLVFADGETSKSTTLTIIDDATAEQPTLLRLVANAPAFAGSSIDVTIIDNDQPSLNLALNRSILSEAAGPGELLATISRTLATSEALLVGISGSSPGAFEVLGPIFIPANQTSVTVSLTPMNNDDIDGLRSITLWAQAFEATSGQLLVESAVQSLDITDDDGPTLTISIDKKILIEGSPASVTITRNIVSASPLSLTLSHDGDSRVSLPIGASIPANQAEVTIALETTDNATIDGTSNLEIIASAPAYAPGYGTVILTDDTRPELLVARVTGIPEVKTNEIGSYSYRIDNQGSTAASGPFLVQAFLSKDQIRSNDDKLIEEYLFTGTVPPNLYFERAGSFIAPLIGGPHYIIIRVDPLNAIDEIVEGNNSGISGLIDVVTAYSATVATTLNVEPAGTPVPLTGTATKINGGPAAFELVNIHISVRETKRIISALTDSNGNFTATFNPLPGEAGSYTIGATHPGTPNASIQDAFTLLGFKTNPSSLALKLTSNDAPVTGSFTLKNLADANQSGLTFTILNAPAGITSTFTPASGGTLGSLAETTVDYSLSASSAVPAGTYDADLRITGAEGGLRQIALELTVCQNTSELSVSARPIKRGMIAGEQSFENFTVHNIGGAPTGPLRIKLPSIPWLSSAVATPLPSLAPDEKAVVSLQLCPDATLPIGLYPGTLVLQADDSQLAVPFEFRLLAQAKGDLTVTCEDEYTYFASGQPLLAGASVVVLDAFTNAEVTTGTSDANGQAVFTDLTEGYYDVVITAEKHTSFRKTIFLDSGSNNSLRAFLPRQTVEYVWTVVPTQIDDRYRIVVDTVFETNVPAPVITVEPSHIDLDAITSETTQIDITITNHGLIAVSDVACSFTSTNQWLFTNLAEDLGTLPAKSSITVPIIITDLQYGQPRALARSGGCGGGKVIWNYECGNSDVGGAKVISTGGGGCGSGSVGDGGPIGGGGGGQVPVVSGSSGSCDPCLTKAILECYIGYLPGSGFVTCPAGLAAAAVSGNLVDPAQAGLNCACVPIQSVGGSLLCNTVNCIIDILQCAYGPNLDFGGARSSVLTLPVFAEFEQYGRDIMVFLDQQMITFGDDAWREHLDSPLFPPFVVVALESLATTSQSGIQISATERTAILATALGVAEPTLVGSLIDRLNRTYAYYDMGIHEIEDLSPGMSEDFITHSSILTAAEAVIAVINRSHAEGYADPFEGYYDKQNKLLDFLTTGGGVCAKVKLRIEQEAVMTRDAFEASLEMSNNDDLPLESLNISLSIIDSNGIDQSALFGIDGSGATNATIAPNTSNNWTWTIVPSALAAPDGEGQYFVNGTVNYMQGDFLVELPLAPQSITVLPTPSLTLKYFHQRDVFSDDPHTDIIEPSIPFSLGVMIENEGAGVGRNLRITSAQPVIIENEKGLFIDFDIIASEVAGQSLSPSLTANFGDLEPGEIKVGRWLIKSSLQGLFTEYEASFEHLNSLGDERLSLIQSVTIHETNHVVDAPGPFDDGLPDFLVNDVPDFGDFPDTLHLSDGTVEPVTPIGSGVVAAPNPLQLSVTLTTDTPAGWTYIRIPEPGDGTFRLTSVVRSDGRILPLDVNAWTTDRTFLGLGLRPIRENKLHLFDHDTTGSYTLTYQQVPPADTQAPNSSVEMLPLANSGLFSVDWTGSDDNAVTSYDIYVSENGGAFSPWLQGTSLSSALYQGVFGTDYSFYSIARDAAGNNEPAKSAGEAMTSVSLVNQPPVLNAIADVTLTEGQRLTTFASATDPDGPDSALRYSISASNPGIIINEISGRIRWNTSESHGGTVTAITVTATDGNTDSASVNITFNVTVLDDNKAPTLASFPAVVIEIDEAFSTFAVGNDSDLPLQTLSYQIVSGFETEMTLNPNTGEFNWTPQDVHGDQTFEVEIEVSDNQIPPLASRKSLLIEVLVDPGFPPVFNPVNALIWKTGSSYSLDLHAEDPEGSPVSLSADFTGLPGWLSIKNGPGDGDATLYWHTSDIPAGIYLVPVTASTDRQSTTAMITVEIIDRATFTDYEGWATAYGFTGPARDPAKVNNASVTNYLAYALGIDPVGGISPAQHEPRTSVIAWDDSSSLCFQLPNGGRTDLRYRVQTSLDLITWETIGTKEGTLPWNIESTITEDPISPNLSIIKVWHDEGTDDNNSRIFRLIVENL